MTIEEVEPWVSSFLESNDGRSDSRPQSGAERVACMKEALQLIGACYVACPRTPCSINVSGSEAETYQEDNQDREWWMNRKIGKGE